jgi:acyl-CoA thioester hydrolase
MPYRAAMPYALRVSPRYLEIDQQGVVFNMWYLAYFDDALSGFLAHLGFPYPQLMADGYDVMLVRTELDWSGGLRFGEVAEIAVRCERVGTTSFTVRFDLQRAGVTLCLGRTVYVLVSTEGNVKQPLPDHLRAALGATTEATGAGG